MAGWLTDLEAHCARRRAEDAADTPPPLIASAEWEGVRPSPSLENLIAVIHRDGGQYQTQCGTEQAVADAMELSSERIARIAALEAELADLRQTYLALEAEVADLRKAADAEARAGDESRAENAKLRACLTEITHHSVCCDARYMAAEALK